MNGKVTYHQQVTYCGKPRCRKCREGVGHGPYWYAYQTVDGQTTRTYIGKNLPPDIQAALDTVPTFTGDADLPVNVSSSSLSDATGAAIRICALGQFRVERRLQQRFQPVTDSSWQQQAVRSLLGYLLCCPERRASRSQISAALWPSLDLETATSRLNKAIQNLRKVLGHPSIDTGTAPGEPLRMGSQPFFSDSEWLSLAGQDVVWVDADAFEERVATVQAVVSTQAQAAISDETIQELRDIVALYSGSFLPEEQDAEWTLARRQSLRRSWIKLLLDLADLYIARDAIPRAIDVLDRLLANDPTNEAGVQRLIVVLAGLKRRGEALRAYQRFSEVLQREYGAVPSAETLALYDAVRQGRGVPSRPTLSGTAPLAAEAAVQARRIFPRAIPVEPIGRVHQSPLVGRNLEMDTIRSILLDLEQGARLRIAEQYQATGLPLDTQRRPQCVMLMGDAGIGKTRLAEEMGREAQQRGWSVVWSRIFTQESSIPYRLWTETLRKILNTGTGLTSILDPYLLLPLVPLMPALRDSIPQSVLDQAPPPHALTPEQEQLRLWEAIGELLKTVSESTSLFIVLDDIQWADSSSHDLLGYLARHLYGYPVLFLGTCRDTELPRRPAHPLRKLIFHMQREHTIKTINVEPLDNEQIAMLASSVSALSEDTLKHIQDRAAGNPFFAEELARSTPPTLPMTVTAALEHRLNRLSKPCRQLLGNAAVLGGSFEYPVICAMESSSDMVDEDAVLDLLEEALQAGVLTDEGTGTRITYHFWHPLVVSHLYEALSAIRRARLHQRAADVLLRVYRGREEEVAATITYHLVKGDAESAQIAYHAELAGNRAYALFAYAEAEHHYRLAVEHMERARLKDGQVHLASLLERLAECTMVRGHFTDARHLYERVLALRDRLSIPEAEARYEAQMRALLWSEIGLTWRYTGDNERAWQSCERSEQVLRDAQVVGGPAWARLSYLRSSLCRQEGRYDEALSMAQEALRLFEEQQQATANQPVSPLARATHIQRTLEGDPINLGRTHRLIGTIAEALGQLTNVLTHQSKALALYEQYDEKRQIAHLSCDMGYIHLKKAEFALAQAELRRAQSLAELIGDEPLLALVYSDWGEMAVATGDLEEAENWYRRALELTEEDLVYISMWNAGLASVLHERDKLNEATRCLRRAWTIGRSMHNNPCIGLALVTLGNMRISQALAARSYPGVFKRLLECAQRDIERALALGELEVETRVRGQLALAHIHFLQGKLEPARNELAQVITSAQQYEQALVESRARQLLEEVFA